MTRGGGMARGGGMTRGGGQKVFNFNDRNKGLGSSEEQVKEEEVKDTKETFAELDRQIEEKYQENLMQESDELEIQSTYERILGLCKKALDQKYEFHLVKYGSAVNGLSISGGKTSDLDLTVVASSVISDDLIEQEKEEHNILCLLH